LRAFLGQAFQIVDQSTRLQDSYYIGVICEHAEALIRGHLRRLVVTCPPGTLKSIIWAVMLPAWTWIDNPEVRFLVGANDESNANRDSVYCRNLIRSEWYQSTFRPSWALSGDQDAKRYYTNTATGHRLAVSTGGNVAGKKGHVLLVDDLHDVQGAKSKVQRESDKQWFRQSFYDRQMDFTSSAVAVIGARTDPGDIQSELIREGWPELRLPERMEDRLRKTYPVSCTTVGTTDPRSEGELLRPTRFGDEQEREAVQTFGARDYRARHQQAPESASGKMFNRNLARLIPAVPVGTVGVRYWDTAASTEDTAAETAGVLMGRTPEGRFVVAHVERGRWEASERNNVMRRVGFADLRRPGFTLSGTFFERGASDAGKERDQLLVRFLAGLNVHVSPARGDKVVRAEPLSAQWAAGNVDVVEADWTEAFLESMNDFPFSLRKDVADASSGAFNKVAVSASDVDPGTAEFDDTEFGRLPSSTFK
jgi:predicted phage terminase large subunit-like protein